MQDRGYYLARGDKRSYVAVDFYGEVYFLSRQTGVKKMQTGVLFAHIHS